VRPGPCWQASPHASGRSVQIGESVRDGDVYIIQVRPPGRAGFPLSFNPNPSYMSNGFSRPPSPTNPTTAADAPVLYQPAVDPNDLLMELLILIS
jgi:phosphoribosylpyrophosphate synthetase